MARVVALPVLSSVPNGDGEDDSLATRLLREQADLSAVERFSQLHDAGEAPLHAERYAALLPAAPPAPGEQYAFEVDLDACSGCKACVTACHNLNGLSEGEAWRSVGLLHGGSSAEPVRKTVTSACHHCLEPACMHGCPASAYAKDEDTGIVRHLDDQCIGCQYCVFTCPFDVPKYQPAMGIVRKCDLCTDRLAEGEAPACVQACPSEAIRIARVRTADVRADALGTFLPGAPEASLTLPTTRYVSREPLPRNLRPADASELRPAHEHAPLVWMLVLTQLAAGAFGARVVFGGGHRHALVAAGLAVLALVASTTHLGRPRYAFRALLNLRRSWLSREVLVFGAFGASALLAAGTVVFRSPHASVAAHLALVTGLLGVGASVMVYAVTGRAWWSPGRTAFRFFGTTAVLGTWSLALAEASAARPAEHLLALAAALTLGKLAGEATDFAPRRHGAVARGAALLRGALRHRTAGRFLLPTVFAGLAPLAVLGAGLSATPLAIVAGLGFVAAFSGEVLERRSFFAAESAARMPGAIGGGR